MDYEHDRRRRGPKRLKKPSTYPKWYDKCDGKVRYRDDTEAKRAASLVNQHNPGVFMRYYECQVCKGFHLTKKKETDTW